MSYCLFFFFFILSQTFLIDGLVPINGKCSQVPKIPNVNNWNVKKFMGIWWEVASYEVNFGTCARLNYKQVNSTNFQEIIDRFLPNGTRVHRVGEGGPSSDRTAIYEVKANLNGVNVVSPHWVVGVDYQHWCVLWLCIDNNGGAFILSRTPTLPKQYEAAVYNVFDKAGFNRTLLHNITNNNCHF